MLKSSTFSFSIFKLITVAIIFYGGNMISQVQGDSVYVESTYAKKFTGRISKVDKEGYFIKTSYNREIFLSKLEIKTIKVVLEWVEPDVDTKASTSIIDSNDGNTDDTNAQEEKSKIEISEKIKGTSELSEFYYKYELANFDISSFNSLEKSKDYRKFKRELSRHLYSKNFSLSFSEKVNFYKFLPSELEKYPNEDFVKYKRTKRTGTAIIVSGGIGVLVGTIWTIINFELTGIGLSGLFVIEIGTIIKLLSNKPLHKSFFTYLKERNP